MIFSNDFETTSGFNCMYKIYNCKILPIIRKKKKKK